MSYIDLTQNEKRSLLVNVIAFNRACNVISGLMKADINTVKTAFAEDSHESVNDMSQDEINSIINEIQRALDNVTDNGFIQFELTTISDKG